MLTNASEIKKLIGDRKFSFHKCSLCGYICGYFIDDGELYYDEGCYCAGNSRCYQPRSDDDLLGFFEMNPHVDEKWVNEHLV